MTVQQGRKAAALFFSVLAALAGLLFLQFQWRPGVDFDVTGFFWVLENAGRLSMLVLFLICSLAAMSFWIRYWIDR